jgi:hypothetical protein
MGIPGFPICRSSAAAKALVVLALCAGAGVAPEIAWADAGSALTFEVRDKGTGRPIPVSGVLLEGPISTTLFTNRDGNATITDLVPGRYAATVGAPKYQRFRMPDFDIGPNASLTIHVELSALGLKVIGTATARRATQNTASRPPPAFRALSLDSLESLGRLPGVDVQDSSGAYGDSSTQISLEGHPPAQTGVSIDGLPVLSPRLANEIIGYASDLFPGASVSFDPRAGALAGSLDFSTVNPSLFWRGSLDATTGAQDVGLLNYAADGSLHRTGFAVVHNVRGNSGRFAGDRFPDASGLDYVHGGANSKTSDLLKVQQLLGDRGSVSVLGVRADRTTDLVCAERINLLPCGFGPGNTLDAAFHYVQADAYGVVGATTIRANVYQSRAWTNFDLSQRFVAGALHPFRLSSVHDTAGGTVVVGASLGYHTLTFTEALLGEHDSIDTAIDALGVRSDVRSHSALTRVVDTLTRGKTSVSLGVGVSRLANTAGGDSSVLVRQRFSDRDEFVATASASRQGAPDVSVPFVPDPGALRFFCDVGVAVGPGPKTFAGATRAETLRAGYSRRWGSDDELSLFAYTQRQHNVAVDLSVPASSFAGALGDSYFAEGSADAASPENCGHGLQLGPGNVFLQTMVPGVDMRYRGVRANGVLSNRSLTAIWQVSVQDALIASLPPSLVGPSSVPKPGDEMPTVPHFTYSLTLDYKHPHSYVEYFAAIRGVGAGNRFSTRGVAAVDLAASAQFRRGTLTARVTDANVDPGNPFQTAGGALLRSAAGTAVPVVTFPRRTRGVSVTLDLPIGDTFRRPVGTGRGLVQTRSTADERVVLALPESAPSDAFRIRNGSTACTFERAKSLTPFLDALTAFTHTIKPVGGAYPADPGIPVPQADGFVVRYHSLGATYALSIAVTNFAQLQAWLGCMRIHQALEDDVRARNLYGSPVGFEGIPVYFMPEIGIYTIAPTTPLTPFRRYALSVPTDAPFAITTYGSCGVYFRPTAEELFPILERDLGRPPITPGDRGRYAVADLGRGAYAITFREQQDLASLLNCAHLSAATALDLAGAGIPARPLPQVNFSAAHGFFIIGNQR